MKKITNTRYQESYVEEVLDNGLHVILWDKPNYEKSLFMMVTPLCALDLKQVDETGKEYEFPAGIAHFLEHKMFESKNGDVMDEFSKMGASVNAFTSYSETAYHFTTSNDVKAPLTLLLDFVQELNITKESVEKEKGIIVQELNMYKQMSDSRLLMETYASLYSEHPLKYDIGGDADSVNSTTLEQLEECYRINYHPSKMILVGVSKENPEYLLQLIKDNQSKKTFPKVAHVERQSYQEPREVARESFSFKMDIGIPKISITYKLAGVEEIYESTRQEWCIKLMLDACFSSLNPRFQTWIDDEIINDYVGCEVDLGSDYGMVMFYAETNKKDEFKRIVNESYQIIQQGIVSEDILDQLKRRYFGQAVRSLNSFDDIAISYARNFFDKSDFFKTLDVLENITLKDVQEICAQLTNDEPCIVEVLPENEEER